MICRRTSWICRAATLGARVVVGAVIAGWVPSASAVDVSAPAILQMFEARWDTIEDRMADVFEVGYGQMWLPPPGRADQGDFSVGYDVFDRFDLGGPRNETLYGTETSLKANITAAHRASVKIYTDLILNHNGFGDLNTVDDQGTMDPSDDVTLAEAGGYPGFALTLPDEPYNDIDGDFHGAFEGGDLNGRLAGLIDIAQEKNYQFIRHPTEVGNPQNIPAGTVGIFGRPPANVPDTSNARFYPDQDLGGLVLNDPALSTSVTRYDFNTATPLAGDPVLESATGLLMRNAQWMIQEIGVAGFRIDAVKHMPTWVLNYIDQAVFRASTRVNHDGTIRPVFMFSEVLDGNKDTVDLYIRKDLPNPLGISPANTTVAGNRDALDFPLFFALRDNLTGNGLANNWHGVRNASQDTKDDGLTNGSRGVAFVDSHDNLPGGFPFLMEVGYAYTLMRPGNALVYLNAKEFGDERDFPHDEPGAASDDALGGFYGERIATLVRLRNSHGRGNFHERWIDEAFGDDNGDGEQKSNIYIYERENSAIVGLSNRLDAGYDERTPVQTGFAPGTVLVELTGNAADPVVDPGGDIPGAIRVDGSGQVAVRIPRNDGHGRGYVVYGVAGPQGALSLDGVSFTMPGATPTAANNGTARLADIAVIQADSFGVRLDTTPVTLPAPMGEANPVRDFDADGDEALLRIDDGMDLNNLPGVDVTDPADVSYGFEQFTETRLPGYVDDGMGGNSGTGTGLYEQQIDTTQLSEGRHYITVRAYRHRDAGEPAVFTDFRKTVYVDRLPPEAEVLSFEPYATAPNNPNNRDLIVRSVDQTADNMHMYLDLPANMTDAEIFALTQMGINDASQYDRDSFVFGFDGTTTTTGGVTSGNHVATVVTFEPTGRYNVQRFAGLFTDTNIGTGFGDLDADGLYEVADVSGSGGFEEVLYSQNDQFDAAADVTGDGLVDNRDLLALGTELVSGGASGAVVAEYEAALLRRADLDGNDHTNSADLALLYTSFGPDSWLFDINVDGTVDVDDAEALITQLVRTIPGDFNLDGTVDAADYTTWRDRVGQTDGALIADGDFDGDVDGQDYDVWSNAFGFQRGPFASGAAALAATVPEPTALVLAISGCLALVGRPRRTVLETCYVSIEVRSKFDKTNELYTQEGHNN